MSIEQDSNTSSTPTSRGGYFSSHQPAARRNITLVAIALSAIITLTALLTRHGPEAASAATNPALTPQREKPEADPSQPRGDAEIALTDDIVSKFEYSPVDVQVPLAELKADPFRGVSSATKPVALPDDAAETRRREEERQAALQAVQSLQLQSISRDDSHRSCTINDVVYQEGQEVDGFVVEEIAMNAVVVRRGPYRFELRVR
jgi:hypothetical protein